jgi:hypothetical protein
MTPVVSSMNRTFCQVCPPSVVLKTPRSSFAFQRCPTAQTNTVSDCFGWTITFAMRSVSSSPIDFHVWPASVVLNTPRPTPTLLRTQDSPVPTHTVSGFA